MTRLSLAFCVSVAGLALSASAPAPGGMVISLEIPRIAVAAYRRPYVAIWIERPDQTAVRTLAVWYDIGQPAGQGKDWLRDMRTWWRRDGRNLTLPADGLSGPTRAPGTHSLTIPAARLRDLPAGDYGLVVEAARELGGRETVRVPFRWGTPGTTQGRGQNELGTVRVTLAR